MALSTQVKNFTAGTITFLDSGGTNSIVLDMENGDYAVTGLGEKLNEVKFYERRGKFKSAAYAERRYLEISLTAMVAQFTDATADVVTDWILRNGAQASIVSTFGSASAIPFAFDIKFDLEGTDYGDSADHTFTVHDFVGTVDFSDGDPCTVSISGRCAGEVTGDLAGEEIS